MYSGSNASWRMPPNFRFLNRCNSAADWSLSFKFGTEFDRITAGTLQVFKIKGSKVKVTVRRNALALKRCKSGTGRLTDLKLCENYSSSERNMCHVFKVFRSYTPGNRNVLDFRSVQ